jgi:uncharacterized NAD(P)/FAD-binding protein YdhS
MAPGRTVVIAGAGFSGVVTAAQLLRRGAGLGLRVVLVNRSGTMARGVAYGTNSPAHVLNVPAGRMGASPDDPEGFLRFARESDPSIAADSFVPRSLYGDYLEWFLADAERAAGPDVRLERVVGEVTGVEPHGNAVVVTVSDGQRIRADKVVLALGNYPPEDPPVCDSSFYRTQPYVRDPWSRGALEGAAQLQSVLLVGTGLTMLDIALDLVGRGLAGSIVAVSRHGLVPQVHRPLAPPAARHRPPGLQTGPATARAYLHTVKDHVRRLAKEGDDWRSVIDSLRSLTPGLWHALCRLERARFLRHLRPYWEVHRHRAAPAAAAAFHRLIDDGQLRIVAGRIQGYAPAAGGVRVAVRLRGSDSVQEFSAERVINCTGPSSDLRALRDPLIDFLRSRQMIRPDALGVGLETADDGTLLDASGVPSPGVYYIGPLLKAMHWESTAVPELRVHAARLAATLVVALAK